MMHEEVKALSQIVTEFRAANDSEVSEIERQRASLKRGEGKGKKGAALPEAPAKQLLKQQILFFVDNLNSLRGGMDKNSSDLLASVPSTPREARERAIRACSSTSTAGAQVGLHASPPRAGPVRPSAARPGLSPPGLARRWPLSARNRRTTRPPCLLGGEQSSCRWPCRLCSSVKRACSAGGTAYWASRWAPMTHSGTQVGCWPHAQAALPARKVAVGSAAWRRRARQESGREARLWVAAVKP